ncbi:uncharacterized protein LOC119582232 [Penaeus monodon]|uniref:uncharacterized protein LOC119582232 n=1 Tax=Penaeus monodon TaxID=6687 RepID=UPI0018A76BE4|nr:uncharacterized protein LOC119582232 [Penaeus monodon]
MVIEYQKDAENALPLLQLVWITFVVSHEINTTLHIQGEKGPQYVFEPIASPSPGQGQNATSVPQSQLESTKEENPTSVLLEQSIPECKDDINHDSLFDRAFLCPTAGSLYKLFEKFEGAIHSMRVKITVEKVDGQLTLQPPPSISIISLFLQNANITEISHETEDQVICDFISNQ